MIETLTELYKSEAVPPTTLLLDLDGVIRLWPRNYSALEQEHNLPLGSVVTAAFESALLEQVITGRITDREWRTRVSHNLAIAYPSSSAEAAVAVWSNLVGSVNDEVLQLVTQVRENCMVGLVTNATDRLPKDLEVLGLSDYFTFIVNSSEVDFAKPSPDIFKHSLALAGVQPSEALFVDDSASNVSAANAIGIRAHHFVSVAALRAFLHSVGLVTDVV